MTRWKLATALVLALLASGCAAPPAGTDGHLTNEWPAMAAPADWAPQAGDCVDWQFENLRFDTYETVDCAKTHRFEIVHMPSYADFRAGDHVVRCHLYLGDTSVSTSMKGVGAAGWPLT